MPSSLRRRTTRASPSARRYSRRRHRPWLRHCAPIPAPTTSRWSCPVAHHLRRFVLHRDNIRRVAHLRSVPARLRRLATSFSSSAWGPCRMKPILEGSGPNAKYRRQLSPVPHRHPWRQLEMMVRPAPAVERSVLRGHAGGVLCQVRPRLRPDRPRLASDTTSRSA